MKHANHKQVFKVSYNRHITIKNTGFLGDCHSYNHKKTISSYLCLEAKSCVLFAWGRDEAETRPTSPRPSKNESIGMALWQERSRKFKLKKKKVKLQHIWRLGWKGMMKNTEHFPRMLIAETVSEPRSIFLDIKGPVCRISDGSPEQANQALALERTLSGFLARCANVTCNSWLSVVLPESYIWVIESMPGPTASAVFSLTYSHNLSVTGKRLAPWGDCEKRALVT